LRASEHLLLTAKGELLGCRDLAFACFQSWNEFGQCQLGGASMGDRDRARKEEGDKNENGFVVWSGGACVHFPCVLNLPLSRETNQRRLNLKTRFYFHRCRCACLLGGGSNQLLGRDRWTEGDA